MHAISAYMYYKRSAAGDCVGFKQCVDTALSIEVLVELVVAVWHCLCRYVLLLCCSLVECVVKLLLIGRHRCVTCYCKQGNSRHPQKRAAAKQFLQVLPADVQQQLLKYSQTEPDSVMLPLQDMTLTSSSKLQVITINCTYMCLHTGDSFNTCTSIHCATIAHQCHLFRFQRTLMR
jgi:hypothetical protein